jgi:hypothetical protein
MTVPPRNAMVDGTKLKLLFTMASAADEVGGEGESSLLSTSLLSLTMERLVSKPALLVQSLRYEKSARPFY